MRARRAGSIVIVVLLVLLVVAYALTWRPSLQPIDPPQRAAFDAGLVAKGAQLAAIGDCNACHTAPGGKTYAGGRALETPFGTTRRAILTSPARRLASPSALPSPHRLRAT